MNLFQHVTFQLKFTVALILLVPTVINFVKCQFGEYGLHQQNHLSTNNTLLM